MTRFSLLLTLFFGFNLIALAANKTIIDIQPDAQSYLLDTKIDDKFGFVRLTNLNPGFNIWYILDVTWPGEKEEFRFHLENTAPDKYTIKIDKSYMDGLLVAEKSAEHKCPLWNVKESDLRKAATAKKVFVPICNDRILVRVQTEGTETTQEFVADFLRKHVWGGEKITGLVKDYLYKDKFLLTSKTGQASGVPALPSPDFKSNPMPKDALIDREFSLTTIEAKDLGILPKDANPNELLGGKWYVSKASDSVFVSVIQPKLVDKDLLSTHTKRVKKLDSIESSALTYLVAFRLKNLDLGFTLGTLHPGLEWSDRVPDKFKKESTPGPDGIDTYEPLVMTGMINPIESPRVMATFTGGFKRTHGAFKWGRLSEVNNASHYGFRVNGVNFSTLQADLATFLIYRDGSIGLKSWTAEDQKNLPEILHARQNGVPIIEWDQESGKGIPGQYVGNWSLGNWSGSAQSEQRALRAAVCLQVYNNESFLIYGYFSSVTPNAMARVFQSYQCKYAMHLDMNALEHTYLALYEKAGDEFKIQHLIKGMDVLDKKVTGSNAIVPRFIGTADNRDFFYVMEKK